MDSRLAHSEHRQDLDNILSRTLMAQLAASGLPRTPAKTAEIKQALKVRDGYERWLEESLQALVHRGHLKYLDGRYSAKGVLPAREAAWQEWNHHKQAYQLIPALAVQTALADKTLQALPDILAGNVRATDIIFPNASMSLVEGIYKNNPIADFFNDTIADLAIGFIEEHLQRDASLRIKVLEVGAGTGGTSARVLPRFDAYRDQIAEYCYTDLSRAFLAHGEQAYGANRPYLRYQIFDVEKPIAGQGLQAGSYDIVIATNVLHATKVIRRTLRNVKAVLRRNGLLLLNELCDKNLSDHLTFGLLEGWWLHEDMALRLPGSPALLPETWQRVLEAEGFRSVFFPTSSARSLGLQVIVAESDGVVRQEKVQPGKRPAVSKPQKKHPTADTARPSRPASGSTGDVAADLMRALVDDVAGLLKLNPKDISLDTDLSEYGFDSISFNQLVNQLNQSYQLELAPTVFFEHPTIEDFAHYLLSEHGACLGDRFSPPTPVAEAHEDDTVTPASPADVRTSRHPSRRPNAKPAPVDEPRREPESPPPAACLRCPPLAETPTQPATRPVSDHQTPNDAPLALTAASANADPVPLSYGQGQLWFLQQLEDLGSAYHVPVVLRLSGSLNVPALEQSLETILQRHQILRACFSAQDGIPVQTILPMEAFRLAVESFEAFPNSDRNAAARIRQQEIIQKPFDLSAGHLFRAVLLRLPAGEHLLVTVMHHIVTDGWSLGVLLKELNALYAAFSQGRAHSLPDLPLQYTDFVAWHRAHVKSDGVRRQLDYWREAFRDIPAGLALPTDRPRPAKPTFRGAALPVALSEPLTRGLRELARGEGVTLYMIFLGAFQLLLSRLSGQTDIAIGTPSAGRSRHELESLIGFFSNTLVLRTNVSGNPNFRELLKRVKETAVGAYAHQDLPFGQIVEALNPTRDLSRPVFFQVMLQLMRAEPVELGGLIAELVPAETEASQFDMTVTLIDGPSQVTGMIEYAIDLFDKATIERLIEQFVALLEEITEAPDHPMSELSLLTKSERQRLLLDWNHTVHDYPRHLCAHQMFEAQTAKSPDAVALASGKRQLTYAELDRSSNQVAHYLKEIGVGPESVVGLFVAHSPEMVIGLLGILKAGGAYLPLDPRYPSERLAYMLDDAHVATLVTVAELASQLPARGARIVRLDADAAQLASQPTAALECHATPENLAYVIYTSGSTGKPKGVAMPHGALVNLICWHVEEAAETRSRRILQLTPISFDVSFQEIFTTLASGRCLLLDNGELRLDRARLLDFIAHNDVEEVFAPQVLLEQIAEEADLRNVSGLPLKRFFQAGEALRVSPAIARLVGQRSQARLHNHYGPSETHVVSSFVLPTNPEESSGTVPIGRPIWNTQLYVLDEHLEPTPIGVAGELYIGGACLARGYLDRPGLTAERFIPHPFADGARLYRTGDRARYLPDGNLEFLGRADDQVKIRGFRVELGEIESTLRACPGVEHVVVVVKGEDASNKKLVAYVVTGSQSLDAEAIRAELRKTLPNYMVPSEFIRLDAFPLTPSGKIDRKSLPEPPAETRRRQVITPRHEVRYENDIAQIWADVLQLPEVSIDDNFFELGGHSLLLMRVHSRLVSLLGKSVPVTALFQYPTVRKFAAHIAQTSDDTNTLRGAQTRGALRKKLIQSR